MGLWHLKIPSEALKLGTEGVAIDDRVAPLAGEQVIVKKRASAFHGTYLAGFPIVVREAVGERVPGVTEWNLFDINAKFGDVEPLETVLTYLRGL